MAKDCFTLQKQAVVYLYPMSVLRSQQAMRAMHVERNIYINHLEVLR